MKNYTLYNYLCTVKGQEYVSFYREHLNNNGIYVKLVIDSEDENEETILMYVGEQLISISEEILKSLRTQDCLFFDPGKKDLKCPDTPYLDTLTEDARWHRNRVFMFRPNNSYNIPGSIYTDWKKQELKKKVISISILLLWFGFPLFFYFISFLIYR